MTRPISAPPLAIVSAYAATIFVAGQFAKVAIIPVVLVLVATVFGPYVRRLGWAAGALVGAYAIPFALYLLNPDRAQSLSKDMHPGWVVVIVAVGLVYIVAYHAIRRGERAASHSGA